MQAYLVIYNKKGRVNPDKLELLMKDFSLNGQRVFSRLEFPGITVLLSGSVETYYHKTPGFFCMVSGHISIENADTVETNAAKAFHSLIPGAFNGMPGGCEGAFAAVYYRAEEHSLLLANDKFGSFPMFVFEDSDNVIASNEYEPITRFNKKSSRYNYDSIAQFYTLGTVLGNNTFFKNIKNLPPASFYVFTKNKVNRITYWTPERINKSTSSLKELAKEILDTFTRVNREYCNKKPDRLYLLSAGADSRLILATLTEGQRKQLTFYTSNLSFLETSEDKDAIGAKMLADHFGLRHTIEKISHYEKPFSVDYFYNQRLPRSSEVLGGWHGGEFLGGYCFKALHLTKETTFDEINAALKKTFSWYFRLRLSQHPYKAYLLEKAKQGGPNAELLFAIKHMLRAFMTSIYGGSRGHWLQPYQLTKHGASPFWDSRFLEKILEVPSGMLKDYTIYNEVLKLCPSEFTSIPSNSPLTLRNDSVIPALAKGIEPKHSLHDSHGNQHRALLNNHSIFKRNFYSSSFQEVLSDRNNPLTNRCLDYETWLNYHIGKP